MLIQIILCGYLLLAVIDVALLGRVLHQGVFVGVSMLNLLFFVFVLGAYSTFFQQLAIHEGKRIVFTPPVFLFFSLAVGSLVGSGVSGSGSILIYLLVSTIIGLIVFSLSSSVFDVFGFKGGRMQYLIRAWIVLLGVIRSVAALRSSSPEDGPSLLPAESSDGSGYAVLSGDTGEEVAPVTGESGSNTFFSGYDLVKDPVSTGAASTGNTDTNSGLVTYRTLLPYLDDQLHFAATNATPTFALVASTSSIYPSFRRAWGMNMIGTNINPDRQVRCGNLMVLLGIAQKWEVSSSIPVLDAYREAAVARQMTGGCQDAQQVVTWADIPRLSSR